MVFSIAVLSISTFSILLVMGLIITFSIMMFSISVHSITTFRIFILMGLIATFSISLGYPD
jgi:hypothetical protein